MSVGHDAALAALKAAEAALEAAEAVENSAPADGSEVASAVAEATTPSAVAVLVERKLAASKQKYLDMGPDYLGPTAINGT